MAKLATINDKSLDQTSPLTLYPYQDNRAPGRRSCRLRPTISAQEPKHLCFQRLNDMPGGVKSGRIASTQQSQSLFRPLSLMLCPSQVSGVPGGRFCLYKTSFLTFCPSRVNRVPGDRSYRQRPTTSARLERVKFKWMNQCLVWSFTLWKVERPSDSPSVRYFVGVFQKST